MNAKKLDFKNINGSQKAAIFLLIMGEEYASDIFSRLSEEEIKKIAVAMAEVDHIPPEVLTEVMEEFVAGYEDPNRLVIKGGHFLKNVIGKALDPNKAKLIFKEIEGKNKNGLLYGAGILMLLDLKNILNVSILRPLLWFWRIFHRKLHLKSSYPLQRIKKGISLCE